MPNFRNMGEIKRTRVMYRECIKSLIEEIEDWDADEDEMSNETWLIYNGAKALIDNSDLSIDSDAAYKAIEIWRERRIAAKQKNLK